MDALDLLALRLVREGFGTWAEVMATPVDVVMRAFYYFDFCAQYSETSYELNKPPDP